MTINIINVIIYIFIIINPNSYYWYCVNDTTNVIQLCFKWSEIGYAKRGPIVYSKQIM